MCAEPLLFNEKIIFLGLFTLGNIGKKKKNRREEEEREQGRRKKEKRHLSVDLKTGSVLKKKKNY